MKARMLTALLLLGLMAGDSVCDSFTPLLAHPHRVFIDCHRGNCTARRRSVIGSEGRDLLSVGERIASGNTDTSDHAHNVNNNNEAKKRMNVIDEFITTVQSSLDAGTFDSFILKGPPDPRRKKKAKNAAEERCIMKDGGDGPLAESIRGKYKLITGRLVLLKDKTKTMKKKTMRNENNDNTNDDIGISSPTTLFVQITIKYHLATDVVKNWKFDEVYSGLQQLLLPSSSVKGDNNNKHNIAQQPTLLQSEWGVGNAYNNSEMMMMIQSGQLITSMGVYELRSFPNNSSNNSKSKTNNNGCYFRLLSNNSVNNNKTSKDKLQQQHSSSTTSSSTKSDNDNEELLPPPSSLLQHDRKKNVPLSSASPYLYKLGITNKVGKPMVGMSSKLRQCQKFVDIVGKLIDDFIIQQQLPSLLSTTTTAITETLMTQNHQHQKYSRIHTMDMGCGRGYLTFCLHSYLYNKYSAASKSSREAGNRQQDDSSGGIIVETRGIDRRPKLINEMNSIALELGNEFATLTFDLGSISSSSSSSTTTSNNNIANDYNNNDYNNDDNIIGQSIFEGTVGNVREAIPATTALTEEKNVNINDDSLSKTLDVVIALHACDTATDDALYYAISRNADIIVVAPCCQYELRRQIDQYTTNIINTGVSSSSSDDRHPLEDVLRHAIYRERATETVTDAIRAILLDIAGYETKVFEFIGTEHTAKNVMITATKTKTRIWKNDEQLLQQQQQHDIRDDDVQRRRKKLETLARFYGIERQRLASLMGEKLYE